jgi:hypothetical protein
VIILEVLVDIFSKEKNVFIKKHDEQIKMQQL